jgi:hypothetical protein
MADSLPPFKKVVPGMRGFLELYPATVLAVVQADPEPLLMVEHGFNFPHSPPRRRLWLLRSEWYERAKGVVAPQA